MCDKLFCKICGLKFKTFSAIPTHLTRSHNIKIQDYFDLFFKKKNSGICEICGNKTKFISFRKEYHRFCSTKCSNNSQEALQRLKTLNNTPSFQEKRKIGIQIKWSNQEYRKNESKRRKELEKNPEYKKRRSKKTKQMWEQDGFREQVIPNMIKAQNNEIQKNKVSESSKRCWKDPIYRNKVISKIMRFWNDPIKKKKHVECNVRRGERHPAWNPNRDEVFSPYTEKFYDKKFRQKIRVDQKSICLICFKELDEKNHPLHHINYIKTDDSRENLMMVHTSCNIKVNGKRDIWSKKLRILNEELIKKVYQK